MRASLLSVLSLLFIASCPAPAPIPGPVEPDPVVEPPAGPDVKADLTAFGDEMCACSDPTCRDGVIAKLEAYGAEHGAKLEGDASLEPFARRIHECATKASENAGSEIVAEFAAIADSMCACADKACAERVNAEFDVWMTKHEAASGSKESQAQAKTIAERYTQCMTAAMAEPTAPSVGEKCGDADLCADGLECVKYYGIAGKRGGEFTSCERRCGKGKPACPAGQACATIADGPGQVCRAK